MNRRPIRGTDDALEVRWTATLVVTVPASIGRALISSVASLLNIPKPSHSTIYRTKIHCYRPRARRTTTRSFYLGVCDRSYCISEFLYQRLQHSAQTPNGCSGVVDLNMYINVNYLVFYDSNVLLIYMPCGLLYCNHTTCTISSTVLIPKVQRCSQNCATSVVYRRAVLIQYYTYRAIGAADMLIFPPIRWGNIGNRAKRGGKTRRSYRRPPGW